jgi:hypothetical protein
MKTRLCAIPLALIAALSGPALADPIPYPNKGTVAPTTFFQGQGQDVTGYFAGSVNAGFFEQVGMYVNGVLSPTGFVFPNHDTATGAKLDLGFAPAGSRVVFALQVWDTFKGNQPTGTTTAGTGNLHYTGTPSYLLYSVPNDPLFPFISNSDGSNHVYATAFTQADVNSLLPVTGEYVGFEDLLTDGTSGQASDLNYTDSQFVFTNVSASATPPTSAVPEPSSLVTLLVAGVGAAGWRRWRVVPQTA